MATGDLDDERTDTAPSPKAGLENRRVVDFNPEDKDWEDEEDVQLAGLGTTTHRSRHRNRHSIPVRRHRGFVKRRANARVTAEKKRVVTGNQAKALAADIELWETECEERAHSLAEKHGLKVKEVRRRMLLSTTFKPHRRVSPYNAKISRIMADLNDGELAFRTAVGGAS
jgi:hypothetical protein